MAVVTRLGLYGGPRAPYPGFVPAAANAVITGTAVGVLESEIVAGGQTIIITVANDTWVAAGATFNAQRQAIIDGLDSDGVAVAGWNAEVRDKEVVESVVRTSDTVVTITLTAAAAYSIDVDETITVTVPAAALTAASEIVATPTFDVTAEAAAQQGGGWLSPEQVRALDRIQRENEREREGESRRRKQRASRRIAELERLYNEIHGIVPPEPVIAAEIRQAVEPFAASSDSAIPQPAAIDWQALLASQNAVRELSIAIQEASRIRFEEEESIMMLMMVA